MKASIANSIERAQGYLDRGQLDYALGSIDGLAEHLESIAMRGEEAEGSEELAADQIVDMETALREAALGILTHGMERARAGLADARKALFRSYGAAALP